MQPLWKPSPEQIQQSNMNAFMAFVRDKCDSDISEYSGLYNWSIKNIENFWSYIWDFTGVVSSNKGDVVLLDDEKMPGARWFPEAELNFAENLLAYNDDSTAIVFRNEKGTRTEISYKELNLRVAQLAKSLRDLGVTQGDRIAGFLPNLPETVIAMLATTSIGAIWSSTSPDFGVKGVLDRFGQIKPKVLFAADGYFYNGKTMELSDRIEQISSQLENLEKLVLIPYINSDKSNFAGIKNSIWWADFIKPENPAELTFEQLPFDHPVFIMYSSGTTGLPKSIVHGAGGTLLQHKKELILHTDLKREDRIFYFTTCGWMMWNWLISSLSVGATIVLYDGSPTYPEFSTLFQMAEEEKISVFGTSAKFLAAIEKGGIKPGKQYDLSNLRAILSTGSPLLPESFDFVYRDIKSDLCLSSISGGTDIISCFALGNPIGEVWRGELQTPGLGMAVDIFNVNGQSIRDEKGELVCTKPFPSMPVSFWNDEDGKKYQKAYFSTFPDIWHHGDFAEITEHGGVIIHGRSDAVLNPGGVRIGTAEIYRVVDNMDEVAESVCVGQEWKGDVRVILFVHMADGFKLDDSLRSRIKQNIRANTTPRHVPAKVIEVKGIPRTISGKITEIAVRDIIHSRPVKNTDALANPNTLEFYKDLPELMEN